MNTTEPEIFTTSISKLVTGGAGLGRCDDLAAFIPMTAPGDEVRARVVRRRKSFVEAELLEILTPGEGRQDPPCPHFGDCGGCDWQHLTDAVQYSAKAEIVRDCFRRLGGLEIDDVLTGPDPAGPSCSYRRKIRLFASPTGHYGMMRRGTNEVVALETCLLPPPVFNETILPWLRLLPPVEQIVVRLDDEDRFLISLFGRPNRARVLKRMLGELESGQPPLPGCIGILLNNLPMWGRDYLVMQVAGKKYRVGAQSFFQANLEEADAVISTAREWLASSRETGGLLADLFCGVGLFSLALADRFDRVLATDADSHAVQDARNNVQRDSTARDRVRVEEATIARVLIGEEFVAAEDWSDACCLLDPPRRGLGQRALAALRDRQPRDILYLSCDPATLARDVASLAGDGYSVQRARVFDMFPQTAHIETLVHLTRT